MDEKAFSSLLAKMFSQNGMERLISFEKSEKLCLLTQHMAEENEKFNLTAITEPEKVILLHYIDSLTLLPFLKKGASLADIGTGAGFPALPLAVFRPDLRISAFDATEKRVSYVAQTASLLSLSNLTAQTLRAESGAKTAELREHFDAVTARGVAELRILCEYCLPYVRVGGIFMAMKGQNLTFELAGAKRAIAMLGGKLQGIKDATLISSSGEKVEHKIVVIEKICKTNVLYPRENNQILKKPL